MKFSCLIETLTQISRKAPLQTVLILPFVLQILGVVSLVGYFSFRNGQQTVNELSGQLRRGITNRIEEKLKTYTEIPHTINQFNAIALAQGNIDVDNATGADQFWQQTKMFPITSLIYCGSETSGGVLGVGRLAGENSLQIWLSNAYTKNVPNFYSLNAHGDRAQFLGKDSKTFNARLRPWYKAAVTAKAATWSVIYPDFTTGLPTITASLPIYNDDQTLRGVCATDFFLPQEMNRFLESLEIGKSGTAFIIERSGMLVSTSREQPPPIDRSQSPPRINAIDSQNKTVRETAKYLRDRFGDLNHIQDSEQLEFNLNDHPQFIQVLPFQDDRGLNWLIVTVLPEADFMQQIQANTRTTILLCIAALIISVLMSIGITKWITRPIIHLCESAKALAQGDWEHTVKIERSGDLGELAASFNAMAHQLQISFTQMEFLNATLIKSENRLQHLLQTVEQQVVERTHELQQEISERKQVEAALRTSEDRYRNFVEHTSEGIWRLDMIEAIAIDRPEAEQVQALCEQGYLGDCNPVMAQQHGLCNAEEMLGAKLEDLFLFSNPNNVDYIHRFVHSGYDLTYLESHEVNDQGRAKCFLHSLVGVVEQGFLVRAWGGQRDITDRKKAEETSVLEERNRIAREIHDTLAQVLTGVIMRMETAKVIIPSESKARDVIDQTHQLAHEGLAEARRSVWALRPPVPTPEGLSHTLNRLIQGLIAGIPIQVKCAFQEPPCLIPTEVETNLLRIVQEALINALKHANANAIAIELTFDVRAICLRVQDNGDGFNPDSQSSTGFGLIGMRERVQRLGGQLTIVSQVGQGTEILAVMPLASIPRSLTQGVFYEPDATD
jgi:signal transduction histidine kinase